MNAKHLMAGTIVGVLTLAGCMSLEERLASNDAQIRRAAEYELVSNARKSGKVDECVAAVGRVSDQQLLLAVAQSSPNGYEKEGIAAVGKISDEANLLTISKTAKSEKVAEAALGKLTKQESLLDVAKGAQLQSARLGAYMRLNDQDQLLQVAMTSQDGKIKRAAIDKVADQEKLLPMVFAPKSSPELVDAFIAKCANADVFLKLVKEHGAQLTDAQCAVIKGKTKNQSILKLIDSVADLKIAAQARASRDPRQYSKFLDAIHNDDIRHDLCVDLLLKWNTISKLPERELQEKYSAFNSITFSYEVEEGIYSRVVEQLRESDLELVGSAVKVVGTELSAHMTRLVNKYISPGIRLSVLKKMLDTAGNEDSCKDIEEVVAKDIAKKRIELLKVLKVFRGRVIHNDKLAKTMVEAIKSSSEAELFLECDFLTGMYFDDAKKILREAIERVVPLIGEKERAKGVASARKHISERKQTEFSFGPFFVGMSVYEATLLAADEKVQKGVSFDYEFECVKDWETIMKDWRSNLKVTSISFTRKGALKYLDCEDSTILQQTIKQYVKKEKGKANSYDYASEIKHDVEVNTYRSINLFSPTGTKLNIDSETWRIYTNSRMGVRIAHAEKSGVLTISELAD